MSIKTKIFLIFASTILIAASAIAKNRGGSGGEGGAGIYGGIGGSGGNGGTSHSSGVGGRGGDVGNPPIFNGAYL